MTDKLTVKQENFAQKHVELSNASEAYRASYNAENMSNEAIWVEACRMLADPKVALRVFELQEAAATRHEITVDDLIVELEEARKMAKDLDHTSTMVSATLGKSKMLGFDKTKIDVSGNLTLSETLADTDEPSTDEIGEEED